MMFDWVNECREARRSRMGGRREGIVEKGEIWGVVWKGIGMEGMGWRVWYVTKQ